MKCTPAHLFGGHRCLQDSPAHLSVVCRYEYSNVSHCGWGLTTLPSATGGGCSYGTQLQFLDSTAAANWARGMPSRL